MAIGNAISSAVSSAINTVVKKIKENDPVVQQVKTGVQQISQPKTSYQQNLAVDTPKQPETTRSILGNIAKITLKDPQQGLSLFEQLKLYQSDPSTPVYNPFLQATNPSIQTLANLGFDVSNIDDKWFEDNAYLMNYYETSNTTNNVKAPTKKSSTLSQAAYAYNQLWDARETSNKALQEFNAAMEEAATLAQMPDRNYSDDQIVEMVYGNKKKYPTLAKMEESKLSGEPIELNFAVPYSKDALYGAVYMGRNPDYKGDLNGAMAKSYNGVDNVWKEDPDVQNKLKRGDDFAPYSLGSTLDAERLYYKQLNFTNEWVDSHYDEYANSEDATERKMFGNIYEANEATKVLEAERDAIYNRFNTLVKNGYSAEKALDEIHADTKSFGHLFKLDETMKSPNADLVKTTRPIDYKWETFEKQALDWYASQDKNSSTVAYTEDLVKSLTGTAKPTETPAGTVAPTTPPTSTPTTTQSPSPSPTPAQITEQAQKEQIEAVAPAIVKNGTDAQKLVLQAGKTLQFAASVATLQQIVPENEALRKSAADSLAAKTSETYIGDLRVIRDYEQTESALKATQDRLNLVMREYNSLNSRFENSGNVSGFDAAFVGWIQNDPDWEEIKANIQSDDVGKKAMGYQAFNGKMFEGQFAAVGDHEDIFSQMSVKDGKLQGVPEKIERLADAAIKGEVNPEGNTPLTAAEEDTMFAFEEEMGELQEEIRSLTADLNGKQKAYNDAKNDRDRLLTSYAENEKVFGDQFDKTLLDDIDTAYQLSQTYEAPTFTADNVYDMAVEDGAERSEVSTQARLNLAGGVEALERLKRTIDDIDQYGVPFSKEERRNIEQRIANLELELYGNAAFLLDEQKDFEKIARAQMAKGYEDKIGGYSDLTKANIDAMTTGYLGNWLDNAPVLAQYIPLDEFQGQIVNDPGNRYLIADVLRSINEREKLRYFYLLSEEGEDAANRYFQHLVNPDYGALWTRSSQDRSEELSEKMSQSGWNALGGYALSFITNVRGNMEAALTSAEDWITGKTSHPFGEKYAYTNFTTDLRGGALDYLHKKFGESEFLDTVFNAETSAIDSMISSLLTTGGMDFLGEALPVFKKIQGFLEAAGSGKHGGFANALSSWEHAIPMALGAAAQRDHEAVIQGATPEQRQALFLSTFFAESVSEALTYGNIKGMFEKGSTEALKGFFTSLLSNGMEEALGEGFNQWWENNAETAILGEKSEYGRMLDYYMNELKLPKSVAEDMAAEQMTKSVLLAAASGFISSGFSSTSSYVAGSAVNAIRSPYSASDITKRDTAILNFAGRHNQPTNASISIAAILGTDMRPEEAKAVAQHIVGGGSVPQAVGLMQGVIANENPQGKQAVAYAAMTSGVANRTLQDLAQKAKEGLPITETDVNNLVAAVAEDKNGPNAEALAKEMKDKIRENRIANKTLEKAATPENKKALDDQQAKVDEAQKKKDDADSKLEDTKGQLVTATQNAQDAITELENNPQDTANIGTVQQTAEQVAALQDKVQEETKNSEDAQEEVAKAEEEQTKVENTVVAQATEEATVETDQEMADEAEQEKLDAEIREKAETAARENKNFARLSAEDFVYENFPNLSEADRKYAIDRVMDIQKRMSSDSDSILARGRFGEAIAKKFNLKYREIGTSKGKKSEDEKYAPRFNARVNPMTGVLEVNKSATQGDIMYALLIHEVTHLAENSKTYKDLADAVLQMRFGEGMTYDGILNLIKSGDVSSRLAQDVLSIKQRYDTKLGGDHSNEYALQEIVADSVGYVVAGDQAAIDQLVAEKPSLARRILDSIKSFLKKVAGLDDATLTKAQQVATMLETAINDSQGKIRPGMTDDQRYNAIKGKSVSVPVCDQNTFSLADARAYDQIVSQGEAEIKLRTLADKIGLWKSGVPLTNKYLNFDVEFVRESIKETIQKNGISAGTFAALMHVFRETYNNAVPIIAEGNQYKLTQKQANQRTDGFTKLLGAFEYNGHTIPVEFDIKQSKTDSNRLYVVTTIEGDPLQPTTSNNAVSAGPVGSPRDISIEGIIALVKPENNDMLASIPSKFLSSDQLNGKRQGLVDKGEYLYNKTRQAGDSTSVNMTDRRIDSAIAQYDGKAYITYVNPADFVDVSSKDPDQVANESRPLIASEMRMVEETPVLRYNPKTGKIIEADGQHRMVALANSKVDQVAVLLVPDGVNGNLEAIDSLNVNGKNGMSVNLTNLIPVTESNRQSIIDAYGESDNWFRYSLPDENKITDSDGNPVATELPGGTVALDDDDGFRYSLSSFTPDEQNRVRQALYNKKGPDGKNEFTHAEVDKYLDDAMSIAAMIAADKQRLDFDANSHLDFLKKNQDYYYTLDASTLCAKRLLYQGTFNAAQHLLPNEAFMPDDLIDLVNIMREMGYETPCGICYVESRRRWLDKYAQEWLDEYEGENKPTLDQLTTSDGLEELRQTDHDTYQAFVDAMNAKGSANPKVVQLRTEYTGDIGRLSANDIQKVKDIGGLRIQSFSDFETPHLLDMIQAVYDMAAVGLTSQAYTKVPNFAWVFGDTGIKINLSLIGKGTGVDENGNLVFDNVEGMNFEEAMKLRERYSKNVGTILVGMNDEHIIASMGDPRIDFIIPFHRSGWSKGELSRISVLNNYSDYTATQNEQVIIGEKIVTEKGKGKKAVDNWIAKNGDNHPGYQIIEEGNGKYTIQYRDGYETESFAKHKERTGESLSNFEPVGANQYWNFDESGEWNARNYLRMCAEAGRTPKFYQFLVDNGDGSFSLPEGNDKRSKSIREGYWKTLTDFKMYENDSYGRDGGEVKGSPQMEVSPDVNMAEAYRVMNEYKLGRQMPDRTNGEKGQFVPMESNNALPQADPAAEAFVEYLKIKRAEQAKLTEQRLADRRAKEAAGIEVKPESKDARDKRIAREGAEIYNTYSGRVFGAYTGDMTLGNTPSETTEEFSQPKQKARYADEEDGYLYSLPSDAPYLSAVNHGDMEEVQRMVDEKAEENGYTMRVYHGTPYGGFTEFHDWSYFTENKDYADRYNHPSQSSTRGRYDAATNPMTYGLYMNPGRVFDTRQPEARELFEQIRMEQGMSELTDNGLPDWTDGRDLIEYIEENDLPYDTIVLNEGADGGYGAPVVPRGESYVTRSNMVKSADPVTYDDNGNVIPLSERFNDQEDDIRYSLPSDDILDQRIRQYFADRDLAEQTNLPDQAQPVDDGSAQRQFGSRTAQQSDALHQEVKDYLFSHSSYTPDTNRDQIDRAMDWVASRATTDDPDGYYAALNEVTSEAFDYRSADGQARMLTVMGMAALKNDLNAELRLADAYNKQGTDLGRQLQARKIFRMMTPIGRQSVLQQQIDQINGQYAREGKTTRVGLPSYIMEAAGAAKTEEEFQRVQKAAARELADQMPANWKEKIRGWRMLSMLGNPRTHIRNVIGNALFIPAVSLKNKMGAIGEMISGQDQRTKTLTPILPKEIRDFARQDAVAMKDTLTGEAKYNEDSMVDRERKTFKGLLQTLSDFNSNALEAEDWFFLKGHYRRALGGWMQANGYTPEQLQNNPSLLEQGRTYAVQEAQKATYRDFNGLAQRLNQMTRNPQTTGQKALGFVIEAALPFKKTPANILKRGLEYSPIGIAKALAVDARHLKQYMDYQNGKLEALPENAISPNQFIDNICSGLTGTAIMAVGAILSSMGVVSCGLGDDDDEFEKAKGNQEYSVRIKLFGQDVTFTMDWAAPMSMPFFVGAAIQDQVAKEGGADLEGLLNSFGKIAEPVFNLSMMDGVNSLFKTSQYDDTNSITQILAKLGLNYATSFVPSALGALARTIDPNRRKAYVESGQGTGPVGTARYTLEQTENKIPGLSQTNIPYRDIWGNPETSGIAERILENFVLPGYISEYKNDPVINEMERLYEATGEKAMIPSDPDKTINFNKEKYILTDKQWDAYKEARGKTAHELLTGLLDNPEYLKASEKVQAEMVKSAWSYADQVGKKAAVPEYEVEELGPDPVTSIAKDGAITGYKAEMMKALKAGDMETYETCVEGMREAGAEDSTIKNQISNTYRDLYKDAYRKGRYDEMVEIENLLYATGFSFDTAAWEKAVDEKYGTP